MHRTKARKKEDEPIKLSKEEDEPNKTWIKAKAPNRIARKEPKTCLRVHMSTEMEEIDGKERRLMWLKNLVDEHATWSVNAPR